MNRDKLLKAIFGEFLKELKSNQGLSLRINQLIERHIGPQESKPKRAHRRNPGPIDPMEVFRESPDSLKEQLEVLGLEQLKDIIAEHGMDQKKLAMKWKSEKRLIDHILAMVESRTQKGDAFRKKPKG